MECYIAIARSKGDERPEGDSPGMFQCYAGRCNEPNRHAKFLSIVPAT